MQIPQTWFEFYASYVDLDKFAPQVQVFPCAALAVGASTSGVAGTIQIPEPFFCFGYRSYGWVTSSGNAPAFPYRIGFKVANGNDWTNGQLAAPMITGDVGRGAATPVSPVIDAWWPWPRELAQNEVVTVTVDNPLQAVALTVEACLIGLVTRRRRFPIQRT